MTSEMHAELLFVAGPQVGQRVALMGNDVIAGRSATAAVQLDESCISRQQLRFEKSPAGWIVENLSSSRMRINRRKYKAGKKILLATGDTIVVGAETVLLFVAPGDDPRATLAAWRDAHPIEPNPVSLPVPEFSPESVVEEETESSAETTLEPVVPAEQAARKAKLKKYAVIFGIYLAALLGVAILLNVLSHDKSPTQAANAPPRLTEEEIADALTAKLDLRPHHFSALESLAKARALMQDAEKPGNLYEAVKAYKAHLAYRGSATFSDQDAAEETRFEDAKEQLTTKVWEQYKRAYIYEQQGAWEAAERQFALLNQMVPETNQDDPVFKVIVENIRDHLAYIAKQAAGKKRRR